jgi:nucleoside phosphorylase
VDQGTGRTRDDLTPRTKARLDPVDPLSETAVAAEMTPHSTVLICCPLAHEFECVKEELKSLWVAARNKRELSERFPEFAAMEKRLLEKESELPREDKIDAAHELTSLPGLNLPNVTCRLTRKKLVVVQSGLGSRTYETASRLISDFDRVCLIGFAGALDPSLLVGDVIEPRAVHSIDQDELPIPVTKIGIYLASKPIVTSNEIISSPADKADLFNKSGCAAVDMEAFQLARLCQSNGKPFHTARAISDAADDLFPKDLNGVILPSGELSKTRLAWAVIRNPTTLIRPLFRLWGNSREAERGLRLIVCRLVESLM